MKIYWYWVLAIGIGAAIIGFPTAAKACPFCFSSTTKEVLHSYYLSVIFMSLLPFGIVGGIAVWIYKNKRSVSGSQVDNGSQDNSNPN